jgi:hypothetical protein
MGGAEKPACFFYPQLRRDEALYHLHSRVQSMESSRQSASHSIGSGCCAQDSMHCSCSARQDSTQVSSSCAWEVDHQKVIPREIKRVPTANRRFIVFSVSSVYIKNVPTQRHGRILFTRIKIPDPLRDDRNQKSVQASSGSGSCSLTLRRGQKSHPDSKAQCPEPISWRVHDQYTARACGPLERTGPVYHPSHTKAVQRPVPGRHLTPPPQGPASPRGRRTGPRYSEPASLGCGISPCMGTGTNRVVDRSVIRDRVNPIHDRGTRGNLA